MHAAMAIRGLMLVSALSIAQNPDVKLVGTTETKREGPAAKVEQTPIDLGRMREGKIVAATFRIHSVGTEDLKILGITPSCGCTTVQLSEAKRTVEPGAVRDITATFDSKGQIGTVHKYVRVITNDPAQPSLDLVFTAEVLSLLQARPGPTINMRTVQRGARPEPVSIFPTDPGKVFELADVELQGATVEYTTETVTDDEGRTGVQFNLTVPPEAELGPVSGNMTVHGRVGDEEAYLPIRIAGLIVGDIMATPVRLQSLSFTTRGRQFAPISVSSSADRPFHILSAEAGPFVDVEVAPLKADREYVVRTTLKDSAPDGPLATTVVLRTDNTGQPVLRIPLFVDVMPRFRVEPEIVMLDPHVPKDTRRVRIQSGVTGKKLEIVAAHCDNAEIVVNVEGGDVLLSEVAFVKVGLRPGADATKPFTTDVVIETNMDQQAQVRIPVEAGVHHGS